MAPAPAQPPADPALARLHEVAERIRQRVAAGRPPAAAAAPVRVRRLPPRPDPPASPSPPRHWSDGPDAEPEEPKQH